MAALIHDDPRIVDRRLNQYFNSTRDQWIEVVKASVSARARCTEDNAKSAPGYYAWDAATARKRQIFCPQGWKRGDHNGIETIVNHDLKKIVAAMNTDSGTADRLRTPRNRTPKGSATERVTDLNNQYELFKVSDVRRVDESPYSFWYLCVHDDGKTVRAEISRPSEFEAATIVGFSERIFILREGDWGKVMLEPQDHGTGSDFEINVRRK